MAKNSHQKVPKSDFQSQFSLNNINLGAHFLFLLILCSIKIERLLFLKFLKILAFFDSYFWPFNKSEEKIKVIFVISAIMPSIWNVFIKFHWRDEKFTSETYPPLRGTWAMFLSCLLLLFQFQCWPNQFSSSQRAILRKLTTK